MKKITLFIFALSSLLGLSQPTTNAPTPTKAPADVVSIYGETYTSIATNFNPNWGQSGFCCVNPTYNPTGVTGTGQNLALAYPTFNYQGTELTQTNAANMEFLHVDVWTSANPATSTLQVSPINNGTGPTEVLVTIPFTSGTWTSIDIPKSAFTGMTWNSVFQLKFAANGAGSTVPVDIYLDNIYFWKNPVAAGSNADLSDLKVDGTTVAGFGPATLVYNVGLPNGTTAIPQVTSTLADPAASQVITQATALPGTATVVVTSQNTLVTKTYTVNFAVVGPAVAAPTPPARPAADVKSIFSDAYTPIATLNYAGVDGQPSNDNTFNTSWCPMNTSLIQVQGNNTNVVTGSPCEGISFLAGRFDATTFTHFHMDIYTDSPTLDKSFNVKFSNWNNTAGEVNAIEFSVTNANFLTNPNPGTWIPLDIPLANFAAINGANRNDLVQFVISTNLGTVYYDNLYLHKNTVLSVSSFEKSNIKMYPNPATTSFTIEAQSSVENVTVYNMLGQEVISKTPNTQQTTIDISTLNVGVYIVKATINGVVSSSRLVKE